MKKIIYLSLVLLIYAGIQQLKAQTINQKAQLKKTAEEFIEIYNTGDTAKYRVYLTKYVKDKSALNRLLWGSKNTFNSIGQVQLKHLDYPSATNVVLTVQEGKFESWWRMNIVTDTAQQFLRRTVLPTPFPETALRETKLSTQEITAEVDNYITKKLADNFSGNVFISREGKEIYQKSFGKDHEGKLNVLTTKFTLASVGKMFTAISFLQLRDKGLLNLNDKVEKYLPELKNKAILNITIAQLLTHTSGMNDYFETPLFQKLKDSLAKPKDYLPFIEEDKPSFEPGKDWRYSNTGFSLLGIILEKVTKLPFKDYIQKNIFTPAGMKESLVKNGDGGGYTTINDLRKLNSALQNNILLKSATKQELFTYTVNGTYGYGTEHQIFANEHVVGHSGGVEQDNLEFNIYPNSKSLVIILANTSPPFAHFLSSKIKGLLLSK